MGLTNNQPDLLNNLVRKISQRIYEKVGNYKVKSKECDKN